MVSVCMFWLLSPASAPACPVLRNICVMIHNLTSPVGSAAGFLTQALIQPAQKGCCTSFNGYQSQLFPMLRKAVAAERPFLLLRSPGGGGPFLLVSQASDLVPCPSALVSSGCKKPSLTEVRSPVDPGLDLTN